MTRFAKSLPFRVRHTFNYDAASAVLDGFYTGTVFQLLLFVGRKTAELSDVQHNLLMSALHMGLLITPLVQAFIPLRRRQFVLATWVLARCSCLFLLFPFFQSGWAFALLSTWIMTSTVLRIPAHASIMRSNYPVGIRNRVLSHVQLLRLYVTVPTNLAVGFMIEYRESWYWPLAVLAACISLAGAYQYSFIRPRGEPQEPRNKPLVPWRDIFHILRTDRQFFWYQAFYILGGIPNLWCLPLYVRLIADVDGGLGARWWEISIMTGLLHPVFMALFIRPWGAFLDRLGNPILQRAVICFVFALHPLSFTFADSVPWAYLCYAIYGFITAGASLNWTLGSLAFGTPEQATAYSSIHTMLTGVRGVIAPWIGTFLVLTIGLHSTFVLASAFMILSGILLFGLHFRTRDSWRPSHN